MPESPDNGESVFRLAVWIDAVHVLYGRELHLRGIHKAIALASQTQVFQYAVDQELRTEYKS